ncbi:MAG TPA: rhomboid family intramembrane serine protease [Planctomycetota bacterium]|nr:rhomboid family intramembrane serine protease [Planctomycetota bacterium]
MNQREVVSAPGLLDAPAGTRRIRGARRPYVTRAILIVCVGVYAVQFLLDARAADRFVGALALDRAAVQRGEVWRLVSVIFVHTLGVHLAINMLGHVLLGGVVERVLGSWRFLLLYLGAGLGGSLLFQVVSRGEVGVGASGAICGVASALLFLALGRTPTGDLALTWRITGWMAFLVLMDHATSLLIERFRGGLLQGTSAHFGGLMGGLALTYVLAPRPPGVEERTLGRRRAVLAVYAALLAAAGAGVVLRKHDPEGLRLDARLVIREALEAAEAGGDFEKAETLWRVLAGPEGEPWREVGYRLFEMLMAAEKPAQAGGVLDSLIESSERDLEQAKQAKAVLPRNLNEIAWYLALKGARLDEALVYAEAAVHAVRRDGEGFWGWLAGGDSSFEEGQYLNTRGWVLLRLGEGLRALRDLEEAARLDPRAANWLYLALGHDTLGNSNEAREAVGKAGNGRDLTPYEAKLLADLRGKLGEE